MVCESGVRCPVCIGMGMRQHISSEVQPVMDLKGLNLKGLRAIATSKRIYRCLETLHKHATELIKIRHSVLLHVGLADLACGCAKRGRSRPHPCAVTIPLR